MWGLKNIEHVDYSRVLQVCMDLLPCEFTVTHLSAVAVTPESQAHKYVTLHLSSTVAKTT